MSSTSRHVGAVLAAAVLWGTTGVVAHHAPSGADQRLVGLATFGGGGLLLLGLSWPHVLPIVRDRSAWTMLTVGAAGVVAYAGFYYWSMDLVGVAVGNALALGSGPAFAGLLELVIERRSPRPAWVAATAVSMAGIALLAVTGGVAASAAVAAAGVLLGLLAGLGYATYSWAAARLVASGRRSRPVMAAIFGAAAVVMVPWFVLAGPGPLLHSARGLTVLAYLAVLPMAAAYLLFGYGLSRLSASTATTLALAEPLVATTLATLVLHERLDGRGLTGLTLVLLGVAVVAVVERTPIAREPR